MFCGFRWSAFAFYRMISTLNEVLLGSGRKFKIRFCAQIFRPWPLLGRTWHLLVLLCVAVFIVMSSINQYKIIGENQSQRRSV